MALRGSVATLALALAAITAMPARADAVSGWFAVVQELTHRVPSATDPVAEQAGPLVALAIYDAVVAIDGGYRMYLGPLQAPADASAPAAASAAAYAVLVRLYPEDRARLDAANEAIIAGVTDPAARAAGIAVGAQAARRLLAHRGIDTPEATTSWRPRTHPGAFVPPQLPARDWLAHLRPFFAAELGQIRTPGPPALDSAAYSSDYKEVLALGGRHSARRTPEQTAIAQFWHSTDLMQLLPQVFAREGRTLAQNARLLAIHATAQFDAGILLAREKYRYGFWRPVTAIRNGDEDGNASTMRMETWEPLLATPSHPDYPCGHCLMGALVGAILTAEIGPEPTGGVMMAGPAGTAPRRYPSFAQMAEEISNSRVWGGVHFRQGASDGAELGRRLAGYILANAFNPVP